MRRSIIFIALCLSTLFLAQGQDNFSESFFYSPKNIQVYIPSFSGIGNNVEVNLAYRSYLGKLSLIRTQYADVNFSLKKPKGDPPTGTQHVLGAAVYGDREGEYFNKTRVLARYALHLPLKKNLLLSGGAALHLINYNFGASGPGASGSDMSWSGNMATSLTSPTFKLGVSINDFNSPQLKPIGYAFVLSPYNCFYGEKTIPVSDETQLRGGGRFNLHWNDGSSFLAHVGLLFSRSIAFTGFYYINKGWGGAIEINKIKLNEENLVDLSFAYQVPTQNQNPPVSQYELNVQYYLRK